jgi:hypothetical protein
MVRRTKNRKRNTAILFTLWLATVPLVAQDATDTPAESKTATDDRVVAGDRVAVLPLWYQEEITVGENLSATVQETIQFILRFLPNYDLVESDTYPTGQSALATYGGENDLDTIIFGRINREEREYTVSLLLYDTASDQIVEVKQDTAFSMLEIFDLTDRLSLEILESYIGRPLAFGALVFQPEGTAPKQYRVYANDLPLGDNVQRLDRFLAGHYTVRVDQVVSEYNVETIFEGGIDVTEGEVTIVSFSRVDVGECLVVIDGPDVPVTLRSGEVELTVTDGERIVLSAGAYEFTAHQPDYQGRPYPLEPVSTTVRSGTDNTLAITTEELGRGFQVIPRRRGGPDTTLADDLPGGGDYTIFLNGESLDGGEVDVLPLDMYEITVEQTIDGTRNTVLDTTLANDGEEQTTVTFPLFESAEQLDSYQRNHEPDLSVVLQALDGNYAQVGVRYETFQRRIGASLLGGFYTYHGDFYTTGKLKLHWLPRGGGSRWTPEFGAIGMVDLQPDGPVFSIGPNAGVSWNFGTPVLESVFIENELRYGIGKDFLLIYFFGFGVRLF